MEEINFELMIGFGVGEVEEEGREEREGVVEMIKFIEKGILANLGLNSGKERKREKREAEGT